MIGNFKAEFNVKKVVYWLMCISSSFNCFDRLRGNNPLMSNYALTELGAFMRTEILCISY